jgi:hypothetical protein
VETTACSEILNTTVSDDDDDDMNKKKDKDVAAATITAMRMSPARIETPNSVSGYNGLRTHNIVRSMGFAGYVTSACSFIVDVSCLTLHVSAYMAIFKCVGYFYFHMPEGICFAGFFFAFFCT